MQQLKVFTLNVHSMTFYMHSSHKQFYVSIMHYSCLVHIGYIPHLEVSKSLHALEGENRKRIQDTWYNFSLSTINISISKKGSSLISQNKILNYGLFC